MTSATTEIVAVASVFSAVAAIAAVITGVYIQNKLAKLSGERSVAEHRQKWIDTLRDTISEYHSIAMTVDVWPIPPDKDRKMSELGTKIELLLNPAEELSKKLLTLKSQMRERQNINERLELDPELVEVAQKILKGEWDRVKSELRGNASSVNP